MSNCNNLGIGLGRGLVGRREGDGGMGKSVDKDVVEESGGSRQKQWIGRGRGIFPRLSSGLIGGCGVPGLEKLASLDISQQRMYFEEEERTTVPETAPVSETRKEKIIADIAVRGQGGRHGFKISKEVPMPKSKEVDEKTPPKEISDSVCLEEQEVGLTALNLNSSCKVPREVTLLQMLKYFRKSGCQDWRKMYEEAILGQVVSTCFEEEDDFLIEAVLWGRKPTDTFLLKGVKMDAVDYYKENYNLKIKNLKQPLLVSHLIPKGSSIRNARLTIIRLIVPELCQMTGLTSEQLQDYQTLTDKAKSSRMSPQHKVHAMNQWIKSVDEGKKDESILEDWDTFFINGEKYGYYY